MAIKRLGENGFVVTGEDDIALYRLLTLRAALRLEIRGMRRRGRSIYSIVKQEFGFKGNKERVLAQLTTLIIRKEIREEDSAEQSTIEVK